MLVHERAKLGVLYRVGFKDKPESADQHAGLRSVSKSRSCCKIFADVDQQPNYSAQPPGV
jgi:hypothetical protein